MPLYEYLCGSCGLKFERIRKFSDAPLTECPSCGGGIEKLLSSPAIQFKGSGFYITDYAKSGAGKNPANTDGKTSADKPATSAEKTASESSAPAAEAKATPATPAPAKADSAK
jgi:putative FmdB family regulatory protein